MRPHTPRHALYDTPSAVVEQLFRSSGLELDWRAIAIKHAITEALHTLNSLLRDLVVLNDRCESVEVPRAELHLLRMVPALLREAVVISRREILVEAVRGLELGRSIDLGPLVEAAIADLQQLQAWQPQIQEGDDVPNL